ncbi:(2,3-dihydroxybenzoyl)adenylate synthase [Quadrisphaera oryzae]|uniref:(2,3-dihydroxybenzoyl)adenylate synthase n=1 Tax=Quadrisphaera TaxID=317661 RepID=UPI00164524B3|nr:AMP-binding protein [Quadrisphaera sp. RL12-1S]MBC3763228.1 AMP-binding protein [Quadrisphaera sp. RL12-1S]
MSCPSRDGVVPWPADVAARYRAAGYWQGRPLGDLLWEVADAHPDEVALVDAGPAQVRLTRRELSERADAAARRLLDLGLRPDDRLLVQLPNGWEFVVLTLACLRSGLIPVMALPAHRKHELTHLASLSQARAVAVPSVLRGFDHEALAHELAEELPDLEHVLVLGTPEDGQPDGAPRDGRSTYLGALVAPPADASEAATDRVVADGLAPAADAVAVLLISGGTTGLPKLIVRTHDDYACNLRATADAAELGSADVYLGTLPASHNFPLACPGVLGVLLVGGRAVMLPSPEPVRAFATVEREGVTISAAVPAVAQRWVDHAAELGEEGRRQLRTLRVLQVGGSRLPDEYAARVRPALGATLQQVFGMAEGLINTTRLDDPDEVVTTTQGRPVHEADEVRVVDPFGRDLPDGEPGALLTRGPYTPRGYYSPPGSPAEQYATAFTADGWYGSGDVVVRRPDGNLVVHGRDKDMINRGGEKISAEEVEDLVYRAGGVDLAAAVAMPDPVLGERVCVYVVPSAGAGVMSLEQLKEAFTSLGVAAFKTPERLEVVGELPMSKVGKIDKKALRADVASRLQHAQTPSTAGSGA